MHDHPSDRPLVHVPARTNGGWGFATVVIVGAILINAAVYWYHTKTYHHPRDVQMRAVGSAAAGGH